MTRAKIKLEYIVNDTNRKSSFNKRKKGLFKKVDELTTLCGVDACAIVFGQHDTEPEVWPSNLGAQRVIAKFKNMPDFQQANKMDNLESFARERVRKVEEKLKKLKHENRDKEMSLLMFKLLAGEGPKLDEMSVSDLNAVRSLVDAKISDIDARMAILTEEREKQARATMASTSSTGGF